MNRMTFSKRKRPRYFVGRWLTVGIFGWLLFTFLRARQLLEESRKIAAHSSKFERDYWVGKTTDPKIEYLVLGDSTAAGWGAERVQDTFPYRIARAMATRGFHVHVTNAAVGGARVKDVRQSQLAAIDAVRPDLITLAIGANDTTHFTSAANYEVEMQKVVSALKRSGAKLVLVANTPNMFQAPALPWLFSVLTDHKAVQQNALLCTLLKHSQIEEVDLYNRGKLIYSQDATLYAADLFHPSGKGYERWAQLFIKKLEPTFTSGTS